MSAPSLFKHLFVFILLASSFASLTSEEIEDEEGEEELVCALNTRDMLETHA